MKKLQNKRDDDRMRRIYVRNWVIAAVSLGLAVFVYFFL